MNHSREISRDRQHRLTIDESSSGDHRKSESAELSLGELSITVLSLTETMGNLHHSDTNARSERSIFVDNRIVGDDV